jgi:hypothetical protein
MHYRAIATDYDGTLAKDGQVDATTMTALRRYQDAGGKLLMVTGRELSDLQRAFPELTMFDGAVVENGAVFYDPRRDRVQTLGDPPPDLFIESLIAQQVNPIQRGRVIVSTWQPHGETVQRTLAALGLDHEVILNKRAVMVLPNGVNKATGLRLALQELGLTANEIAGIFLKEHGQADAQMDFVYFIDDREKRRTTLVSDEAEFLKTFERTKWDIALD